MVESEVTRREKEAKRKGGASSSINLKELMKFG